MASTESGSATARQLEHALEYASARPGQTAMSFGLLAVLLFSVLTIWSHDRWASSGAQVGVFLLALAFAFRSLLLSRGWQWSWLQTPLLVAAVWGLAQLAAQHSIYRFETWSAVLDWITAGLAFVIGLDIFHEETLGRRFRVFAAYFGGVLALWAILQLFSADGKILWMYVPPQGIQPMGPFINRDHYSAFIELLLPIALWEALVNRRRAVLYGCLAAVMYASVIAGASRAGSVLVNLELGAVLIPALTRAGTRGRRGRGRVIFRIVLLLVVFTAIVGWDVLLKRFEDKDPLAGRREAWIAGLAMVRDRPWWGFGLGTWTTAYPAYAVFDEGSILNAAHSDWLQWAGEGGIPFATLMLIVAARALQLGLRAPWGLGITFVFLHSLVDFPLQDRPIFLWLMVILAALETRSSKMQSPM